jgi:hypothetical protein
MLTDTAIRKAKPTDKPQKLVDGHGMYLLLKPDDSRYWTTATAASARRWRWVYIRQ